MRLIRFISVHGLNAGLAVLTIILFFVPGHSDLVQRNPIVAVTSRLYEGWVDLAFHISRRGYVVIMWEFDD